MSYMHITKGGKSIQVHVKDGVSDICYRYVDLKKRTIRSEMGKQLAGKNINPNGTLGRRILQIAEIFWRRSK